MTVCRENTPFGRLLNDRRLREGYRRVMNRNRGFTIVELMITLAVAAILLAVGVPSLFDFINNNRVSGQYNDFVTSLHMARSEAIKRGRKVSVCSSSSGTSCAAGNWEDGWIVWADSDGNGTVESSEIIRVYTTLTGGSTLAASSSAGGSVDSISYLSTGFLNVPVGDVITFQLRNSKCTGDVARDISLNSTGRPSSTKVSCS